MQNYKVYLEAIGEPTEGLDEIIKNQEDKKEYVKYLQRLKQDARAAFESFDRIDDKVKKEYYQERYTNLKLALESIYLFS